MSQTYRLSVRCPGCHRPAWVFPGAWLVERAREESGETPALSERCRGRVTAADGRERICGTIWYVTTREIARAVPMREAG